MRPKKNEPMTGFEPVTSSLPRKRSTPELRRHCFRKRTSNLKKSKVPTANQWMKKRAGDRVRTGDIQLGRLTLYQLSYSRF